MPKEKEKQPYVRPEKRIEDEAGGNAPAAKFNFPLENKMLTLNEFDVIADLAGIDIKEDEKDEVKWLIGEIERGIIIDFDETQVRNGNGKKNETVVIKNMCYADTKGEFPAKKRLIFFNLARKHSEVVKLWDTMTKAVIEAKIAKRVEWIIDSITKEDIKEASFSARGNTLKNLMSILTGKEGVTHKPFLQFNYFGAERSPDELAERMARIIREKAAVLSGNVEKPVYIDGSELIDIEPPLSSETLFDAAIAEEDDEEQAGGIGNTG